MICVVMLATISGCGGSSKSSSSSAAPASASSTATTTASASSTQASGDAAAVHDAVLKFETSADCDGITVAELKKLAGLGENRDQWCKIGRTRAYPPASSVKIQAVTVSGTRATAQVPAEAGGVVVSSGGKPVIEKLGLIKQGGRWLISEVHDD
jgi:hypothetical protein